MNLKRVAFSISPDGPWDVDPDGSDLMLSWSDATPEQAKLYLQTDAEASDQLDIDGSTIDIKGELLPLEQFTLRSDTGEVATFPHNDTSWCELELPASRWLLGMNLQVGGYSGSGTQLTRLQLFRRLDQPQPEQTIDIDSGDTTGLIRLPPMPVAKLRLDFVSPDPAIPGTYAPITADISACLPIVSRLPSGISIGFGPAPIVRLGEDALDPEADIACKDFAAAFARQVDKDPDLRELPLRLQATVGGQIKNIHGNYLPRHETTAFPDQQTERALSIDWSLQTTVPLPGDGLRQLQGLRVCLTAQLEAIERLDCPVGAAAAPRRGRQSDSRHQLAIGLDNTDGRLLAIELTLLHPEQTVEVQAHWHHADGQIPGAALAEAPSSMIVNGNLHVDIANEVKATALLFCVLQCSSGHLVLESFATPSEPAATLWYRRDVSSWQADDGVVACRLIRSLAEAPPPPDIRLAGHLLETDPEQADCLRLPPATLPLDTEGAISLKVSTAAPGSVILRELQMSWFEGET